MLNLDNIVSNKNENQDNNWPFRMLIIGPSGSCKTNTLLHLIQSLNKTTPVDKLYLYAKDLTEPKYEFLINNRKNAGIFTNIDNYNKKRKGKVLIVIDDMIAEVIMKIQSRKELQNIAQENSRDIDFKDF